MCYNANYHRNREAPRGGSRLTGKRGPMERKRIDTDVLIIGGGTAGCFAAMVLGQRPDIRVTIAEKANIRRSGCLAAGVNAINAYITKGHVPQDYVDYARHDAAGIVRGDLLLSMSERLNHVTKVMEDLGLVILKDENGSTSPAAGGTSRSTERTSSRSSRRPHPRRRMSRFSTM